MQLEHHTSNTMKPAVLLQQQLLEEEKNLTKTEDSSDLAAGNHKHKFAFAGPLTLNACRCPHLESVLPHVLDCELVKNLKTNRWQPSNPVHALHLASHLDQDGSTIHFGSEEKMMYCRALYSEEQRRTNAVAKGGMTNSYCPMETPYTTATRTATLSTIDKNKSNSTAIASLESKETKMPNALIQPSGAGKVDPGDEVHVHVRAAADSVKDTPSNNNTDLTNPITATNETSNLMEQEGMNHSSNPTSVTSNSCESPLTHNGKISPLHSETKDGSSLDKARSVETTPPDTVTSKAISKKEEDEHDLEAAQEPMDLIQSSGEDVLPDSRYQELRQIEDYILKQQKTIFSKRKGGVAEAPMNSSKRKAPSSNPKKSKSGTKTGGSRTNVEKGNNGGSIRPPSSTFLPTGSALHLSDFLRLGDMKNLHLTNADSIQWDKDAMFASNKVEEWVEVLRHNRLSFWDQKQRQEKQHKEGKEFPQAFGSIPGDPFQDVSIQRCDMYHSSTRTENGVGRKQEHSGCGTATGDELMQCLECSFIGCGPCSIAPKSDQHIMQHFLETNHTFGITCGPRADIFCFRCGDFVYHEVFDQEKERIDVSRKFPWMKWSENSVQRSFDPLQFLTTPEHGVIWRGLIASYPPLPPSYYLTAARQSVKRLMMFQGKIEGDKLTQGPKALSFTTHQQLFGNWKLGAPVGLYNLGNTCFMNGVIQCLIHCIPLQRYFLGDIGHHHVSCKILRQNIKHSEPPNKSSTSGIQEKGKHPNVKDGGCLACEMDIIFLKYYGGITGEDAYHACQESMPPLSQSASMASAQLDIKGEPLVSSDLLTAAWKSGDMDHLAGYDQRDAHEFLQAFLDVLGKHISQHRKRVRSIIDEHNLHNLKDKAKSKVKEDEDIIKDIFEGTLRSVLICGECGCKRNLSESFLNISLPLSKEMERSTLDADQNGFGIGTRGSRSKITVEKCLKHFTAPEALSDPVHCPVCQKKTPTKKQHTFSRLPRILCLHLKRFDATKNKKIDDFVSFPARGLDMGPHLPHWRESMQNAPVPDSENDEVKQAPSNPQILYDLFGTVNHTGTLHQGHYTSNVKVKGNWYNCNDAFVSRSGDGDGERAVLRSDGAYVLFYTRH